MDEPKGKMLCLQKNQCKGCELCIEVCPRGVLETSEEVNVNSFNIPSFKEELHCNFCRTCEYICPDFSIYVAKI